VNHEKVIDSLHGHKGLALNLSQLDPKFVGFLMQELDANRAHYFHACAELAGAAKLSEPERREFAHAVMYERQIDVLNRLSG